MAIFCYFKIDTYDYSIFIILFFHLCSFMELLIELIQVRIKLCFATVFVGFDKQPQQPSLSLLYQNDQKLHQDQIKDLTKISDKDKNPKC